MAPGPLLIHSKDIDDDVVRNRDNVATVADQRAQFSIDRNPTAAAGQDRAETLASKQRGRLQRKGIELRSAGSPGSS